MLQDARLSIRRLRAQATLSLVAIISVAIGVGSSAAFIEFSEATRQRPVGGLGITNQLFALFVTHERLPGRYSAFDYVDYQSLGESTDDLRLAGYAPLDLFVGVDKGKEPRRVAAAAVTSEFFEVLGVGAEMGTLSAPSSSRADNGLVLSYRFWQDAAGGRADIIGQRGTVNGHPMVITGIAARRFKGVDRMTEVSAWIPMGDYESVAPATHDLMGGGLPRVFVLATSLVDGTRTTVHRWLDTATTALWGDSEHQRYLEAVAFPLQQVAFGPGDSAQVLQEVRRASVVIAILLLVAGLNLATILTTRGQTHTSEIRLRSILGASPAISIRPFVFEAFALVCTGVLAALILGRILLHQLGQHWLADAYPVAPAVTLRFAVLALGIGTLAVAVSVLIPALSLRSGAENEGTGRTSRLVRHSLVCLQIAAVVPLLAVSISLLKDVHESSRVDLGFDPKGVLSGRLDLRSLGYDAHQSYRLLDALERESGRSATPDMAFTAGGLALHGRKIGQMVHPSDLEPSSETPVSRVALVSEAYPRLLRWNLVGGRWFDPSDRSDSELVAIVTEEFQRHFPVETPRVGSELRIAGTELALRIVGVMRDVRLQGPDANPDRLVLVPASQYSNFQFSSLLSSPGVAFRSAYTDSVDVSQVRRFVANREPRETLHDTMPLGQRVRDARSPRLRRGTAMLVLAILGISLATIGIGSLIAESIKRRAVELAVRLALGASPSSLRLHLMRHVAALFATGTLVGLAVFLLLVSSSTSVQLADGTEPSLVLSSAIAIVGVASIAAALLPTIRLSRMSLGVLNRQREIDS